MRISRVPLHVDRVPNSDASHHAIRTLPRRPAHAYGTVDPKWRHVASTLVKTDANRIAGGEPFDAVARIAQPFYKGQDADAEAVDAEAAKAEAANAEAANAEALPLFVVSWGVATQTSVGVGHMERTRAQIRKNLDNSLNITQLYFLKSYILSKSYPVVADCLAHAYKNTELPPLALSPPPLPP